MPASVYSTSSTVVEKTTTDIVVVEDIFYGSTGKPPRVGGVRITFTSLAPDGLKSFDFTVTLNTADTTSLHQKVDILFGGVVFGHVQIDCDGAPDAQNVPPLSTQAWRDDSGGVPASFDAAIV